MLSFDISALESEIGIYPVLVLAALDTGEEDQSYSFNIHVMKIQA